MRRIWIVLMAVSVVMAIALPATAKKPLKPVPEPTLYDVTLTQTGDEGISTTCGELPFVMRGQQAPQGALVADGYEGTSVPRLALEANVSWTRTYPSDDSGQQFTGCHGGALAGSESDIPSYFVVALDRNGHIVGLLWAFDVYVEEGTKGKNKTPDIKEYFRLWASESAQIRAPDGSQCLLDPTRTTICNVSGDFEFWHYYPIEQIGSTVLNFTMTVTPQ